MRNLSSTKEHAKGKGRNKASVFFLVLAMVFLPVLFSAPAAYAGSYDDLTGSPGQECRPRSLGNAAGSGFPGLVDPAPRAIVPSNDSPQAAADAQTLQNGANNRIYHTYGWAGYNWEVCATGGPIKGGEAIGNTDAWGDSEIGSTMLKMAVGVAALNTGVAKMAANPGEVLAPLDKIVVEISALLKTALVDLWLPLVLVAAAAMVAVNALNGNVRRATASIGAILLAIVGVAYLSFAPLQAAQTMDGVASTVQTSVLQQSQKAAGKDNVPADETWGVIYTEDIIFPLWAQGLTNWAQDDPRLRPQLEAERLGPVIESKQQFEAFTPTRAYQIRAYPWGAERDTQTDNARRDAWNTIGEASQTKDAPTRAFTGQDENRAGVGFIALASVGASAAFSIPANLMIFLASVAFRLLPIVGMVLAILMSFEATRNMAYQMGRFFLASMVNGIILGVFAAVHLALVGALFTSDIGFLWATVGTALVTIVFYKVTKPIRSLTNTAVSLGKGVARGVSKRSNNKRAEENAATAQGNQNSPNRDTPTPGIGSKTTETRVTQPLKTQQRIDPPKRSQTQRIIDTTNPQVGVKNGALSKVANVPGVSGKSGARTVMATTARAAAPKATAAGSRAASTRTNNTPGKEKDRSNIPAKPGQAPRSGAQQQGYKSLQQAQASDSARSRQIRVFVPPNAVKDTNSEQRTPQQQGDRPAIRKFIPPAPRNEPEPQEKTVAPLKATRS